MDCCESPHRLCGFSVRLRSLSFNQFKLSAKFSTHSLISSTIDGSQTNWLKFKVQTCWLFFSFASHCFSLSWCFTNYCSWAFAETRSHSQSFSCCLKSQLKVGIPFAWCHTFYYLLRLWNSFVKSKVSYLVFTIWLGNVLKRNSFVFD